MGRIIIDIGHGLYEGLLASDRRFDPGAVSKLTEPSEFDLNLYTAVALQERLQSLGHFAAFVPFGLELLSRGRMAKDFDVFLSIHHNASEERTAQGSECCVHDVHSRPADLELGIRIAESVAGALGIPDRGIVRRRLAVLSGARKTNVKAAVLVEGFFMDTPGLPYGVWPIVEGRAIAAAVHAFLQAGNPVA